MITEDLTGNTIADLAKKFLCGIVAMPASELDFMDRIHVELRKVDTNISSKATYNATAHFNIGGNLFITHSHMENSQQIYSRSELMSIPAKAVDRAVSSLWETVNSAIELCREYVAEGIYIPSRTIARLKVDDAMYNACKLLNISPEIHFTIKLFKEHNSSEEHSFLFLRHTIKTDTCLSCSRETYEQSKKDSYDCTAILNFIGSDYIPDSVEMHTFYGQAYRNL